jgi:uncharacterized protein DUF1761
MQDITFNVWALIVAALIRIVIGALWFSPPAFQSQWLKIVGMDEATMRGGLPRAIAVDVVGSLVMAFVLVHAVVYAGAATIWQGAAVGFFNWLGFIAVVQISETMHEHRPLQFFWIATAYNLIALVLMGALLAVWR